MKDLELIRDHKEMKVPISTQKMLPENAIEYLECEWSWPIMNSMKFTVVIVGFSFILITTFLLAQLLPNHQQSSQQNCPVCDVNKEEKSILLNHNNYKENSIKSETMSVNSNAKILIWVLTGPSRHITHALHVKRTWGAHFDKVLFMSSKEDARLGTIALLNITEGHDNLWPKTQKAFEYVWEHHKDDADWFMKVDDDTFVVSHNLRDYLKDLDPNEPHYLGHSVQWSDLPVPVNYGGTGYILSKTALRLFLEALESGGDCHKEIRKKYKGDEDTELGMCMRSIGILPEKVVDAGGREQMMTVELLGNFEDVFVNFNGTWPRENWKWSPKAISFHQVVPSRMYLLEQLAHVLKVF